jgi:hypothetical protein
MPRPTPEQLATMLQMLTQLTQESATLTQATADRIKSDQAVVSAESDQTSKSQAEATAGSVVDRDFANYQSFIDSIANPPPALFPTSSTKFMASDNASKTFGASPISAFGLDKGGLPPAGPLGDAPDSAPSPKGFDWRGFLAFLQSHAQEIQDGILTVLQLLAIFQGKRGTGN